MTGFKILLKSELNSLPKTSGVYAFFTKNSKFKMDPTGSFCNQNSKFECIYIGKAINIQSRVKNHFQQPSYKDNLFINKVDKIGYLETGSEIEALILEANLIKKQQPKFNVVWRDDKNYFYVAIAQNEKKIPYVFITHQPHSYQNERPSTLIGIEYIGPFVEGTALKKTLRFLRRVFPYYTTSKHPKNKCTYCYLGLCPGPLLFENPPSPEASEGLREYKKNIKKLILVLKGKRATVLNSLKKGMSRYARSGVARKTSAENRDFEKAAQVRDKILNLQQVMAHKGVINNGKEIVANFAGGKNTSFSLLRKFLKIKKISRIECYDVSNIQGKLATGSMVAFINGEADKNQYRKFKIKMKNEPNDIAMLGETLKRRFAHPEWPYPEVILIDGGIAQLNIAIKVKNEKSETKGIKVISIAKRNKDLYIEGRNKFIPLKSLPREIYNLVLQLDAEAHRFAIAYHKKLRKKYLLK